MWGGGVSVMLVRARSLAQSEYSVVVTTNTNVNNIVSPLKSIRHQQSADESSCLPRRHACPPPYCYWQRSNFISASRARELANTHAQTFHERSLGINTAKTHDDEQDSETDARGARLAFDVPAACHHRSESRRTAREGRGAGG